MKKPLLTDDSSPSVENKNDSQLLSLPLPSSSLPSVAPVASNNAAMIVIHHHQVEIDLILLLCIQKLRSVVVEAEGTRYKIVIIINTKVSSSSFSH